MFENNTENGDQFDFQAFQAALSQKIEEYAENRYITHGPSDSREENARKKNRAEELRTELIDDCATAMVDSGDPKRIMEVVRKSLIQYKYGNSRLLMFGSNAVSEFYYDLAVAIAEKK